MNCPITPGRYAQAGFVDGSMRVHDVRRPDSPLAQSVSFSGCQKLYNLRSDGSMCRNAEQRVSRCRVSRLRSEEHTSELQSLMRISYAVFCLKKNTLRQINTATH